jgi:hypothetical protein
MDPGLKEIADIGTIAAGLGTVIALFYTALSDIYKFKNKQGKFLA